MNNHSAKINEVVLKQNISHFNIVIALLPVLLLISFLSMFRIYYLFLFLIFIPVFFLNYEYVINRDFRNMFILRLSKFQILKKEKLLRYPDYISLMHQGYKEGGSWVWYPTIFGDTRYKLYTIKFFERNKHETVFKTPNKEEAILKATELSKLLNVRINNTLKESST